MMMLVVVLSMWRHIEILQKMLVVSLSLAVSTKNFFRRAVINLIINTFQKGIGISINLKMLKRK